MEKGKHEKVQSNNMKLKEINSKLNEIYKADIRLMHKAHYAFTFINKDAGERKSLHKRNPDDSLWWAQTEVSSIYFKMAYYTAKQNT